MERVSSPPAGRCEPQTSPRQEAGVEQRKRCDGTSRALIQAPQELSLARVLARRWLVAQSVVSLWANLGSNFFCSRFWQLLTMNVYKNGAVCPSHKGDGRIYTPSIYVRCEEEGRGREKRKHFTFTGRPAPAARAPASSCGRTWPAPSCCPSFPRCCPPPSASSTGCQTAQTCTTRCRARG